MAFRAYAGVRDGTLRAMSGSDDVHNEIGGGRFFSAVIQSRDIGTVRIEPSADIPAALSGLPAPSAAFTERAAELESLLDVLAPPGASPGASVGASVGARAGLPGRRP